MRSKFVRLSEEEHSQLKRHRNEEFDSSIPLGYVVGKLLEEVTDDE